MVDRFTIEAAAPRRRPGTHLERVGAANCDCFGVIEGLVLQGGPEVEVLTGLALHAGLPDAWPATGVTTARICPRCRVVGGPSGCRPAFAQRDNDTCFRGPHQFADVVGQISRLCLQAGCTPVFTPVKDPSFQAGVYASVLLTSHPPTWMAKTTQAHPPRSVVRGGCMAVPE